MLCGAPGQASHTKLWAKLMRDCFHIAMLILFQCISHFDDHIDVFYLNSTISTALKCSVFLKDLQNCWKILISEKLLEKSDKKMLNFFS